MNYIGSKLSLLDFIEKSIHSIISKDNLVFCDLFAGTGAVGLHFKRLGYKVVANDIQYYSFVLNRHYVGNHKDLKFNTLNKIIPEIKAKSSKDKIGLVFNYLNTLKPVKGFIYKNYCLGGTINSKEPRMYFSDYNGMLCDAIRQEIEEWKNKKLINDDEYYFLITSLLESIDKYANTASVYGAFLKKLKKTAEKIFVLKPALLVVNDHNHNVYNEDINNLISKVEGDILYLDPPYNQRQYATNYHLLETIAKYDNPKVFGKTGLREYQDQKSLFCSKIEAKKAFSDLIEKANMKYIFLSYNNEGIMSPREIKEIMSRKGKYGFFKKEYTRFKSDTSDKRNYKQGKTYEYLHYVVCN